MESRSSRATVLSRAGLARRKKKSLLCIARIHTQ